MKHKILKSWEKDGVYFIEVQDIGIWHCTDKKQWEDAVSLGYIHMGEEE